MKDLLKRKKFTLLQFFDIPNNYYAYVEILPLSIHFSSCHHFALNHIIFLPASPSAQIYSFIEKFNGIEFHLDGDVYLEQLSMKTGMYSMFIGLYGQSSEPLLYFCSTVHRIIYI